ncbi:MAG: hypothetical protein EZS28_017914 [Streblomastix strix]|uniref:Reverse transcriptase domain-containing protein n=1 Tax=Streblomastix strix TaxID=222440 RepID=A0A5J4VVG7_9EUKA|nr:MAG: hypothetical protein EZS28_017914 [Streblomastix strix]
MPFGVSTAPTIFSQCLQSVIAEIKKRFSSKIFICMDNILILNLDLTILQLEIHQVMKTQHEVLGLAVEHKNNDNANDNISKEGNIEIIKTFDAVGQEKEAHKNMRLGIGNWRDPIHKSTIQMRHPSHQEGLKVEGQGSSQQRLEQVDSTQQVRDTRHNLVDQQASPQPITVFHEAKQTDNDPNRCVQLRMGGNADQRESREAVRTWKMNGQQSQELQSMKNYSSSESASRIPSRIDLIAVYLKTITNRKHSQNVLPQQGQRINYDRATSRQIPQVHRIIHLDNRASHIPDLSNTIPDRLSSLSRCGEISVKKEILQKTQKEHGIWISIDIIATSANRQRMMYCSISKDKFAVKRNVFSLEWSKEVPLRLPPISQTTENYQEGQKRVQPDCSLNSSILSKLQAVYRTQRGYNSVDMHRKEYLSLNV